jgi:ribokinase
VHFCAPLGCEPEAAMIRAALAAEGFASVDLPDVGLPTDLSTLLVADDAENCIISTGDCAAALGEAHAIGFVRRMAAADWLLVQGNLSEAATFAAVSRAGHVVMNTAPLRWEARRVLARCAVVVANEGEAAAVTGCADPALAVGRLGGAVGIVTLGGRGCLVAGGGNVVAYPAVPVTAVDTTGAGDTFCGILTAMLARGARLQDAVMAAQRAASWTVGHAGCFASLPPQAILSQWLCGRR